jgi:hypothetical protein
MTGRPPRLAGTTYGKGSAAKQDAIRKGKVAASKAKLDALKARQAEALGPLLDSDEDDGRWDAYREGKQP